MIRLTQNDWRIFRRLQRKHKVSTEFLRYNLENIEKFIWFETWPRIVIRRYAMRRGNRVFIIYYRLRRVLFDQSNSKMLKRMRQNIKQWSKRIVAWHKKHSGIKEFVEEVMYEDRSKEKQKSVGNYNASCAINDDVSKQLKEQLELLRNGRRPQSLITKVATKELDSCEKKLLINNSCDNYKSGEREEKKKSDINSVSDVRKHVKPAIRPQDIGAKENQFVESSSIGTQRDWQINLESTPEKQTTNRENLQPVKQLHTDEKTEKSHTELTTQQTEKLKTGLNFLDMLMCKVSGSGASTTNTSLNEKKDVQRMSSSSSKESYQHYHEHSMDSTDGFLGFDDCEKIPGMLMTPVVPHSNKNCKNSVFVSESLNEYMRLNDLETNYSIDEDKSVTKGKIFARDIEGLMTPKTKPPPFDMPAVPENLLKFRTVAERKQYLQKFSKNYRLAIINNEASIYRELQRRMRTQKVKSASQLLTQSPNSSMSFTRNGWIAASFINTEFNKYYYQILDVDHGAFKVRLKGARGNNDEFNKTPYVSRLVRTPKGCCGEYCVDDKVWQYLKPIKTIAEKNKKLNKGSLVSVFKPCPLSHKTFQKPLDDDTAALLLAGGSMAVVRMPTVELEVFPEHGKPLHEIAKRYLQYILPHHDISREWAEFSVSTLQEPKTLREAEQAAAKSFSSDLRKSYTFFIPYLNDRNHILVRRVVDRSEKLDESFEQCLEEAELVPKTDFSFRKNLDLADSDLLTCADIVSDMINTVAISCSENSFIKNDPDGLNIDEDLKNKILDNSKHDGLERPVLSPNAPVVFGGIPKKQKKQNSLLLELKRLNATIINAAAKPEIDKKQCSKDYCQMGCICASLDEIVPLREHCGKTKCMLECSCKSTNQSRIMRLETDGRSLTTEDAFLLRRKATARLARMEKEFTSTVVLTGNETLLINETNNDKKRRCTKAPKRYEDFTDTEDEQRRNSPKKTALTSIEKEKHLGIDFTEVYEPVYVKDSIFEQLKHCTVNIVPLQDMDNIAHWCMVHNLYKCFCKGRALEGKPVVIEKEENNTTVQHVAEQKNDIDYNIHTKAKYTFDKVEKKKNASSDDDEQVFSNDNRVAVFDEPEQYGRDDNNCCVKEKKRKRKEYSQLKAEKVTNQSNTDEDSEETAEDEYTSNGFACRPHLAEMQRSKRSLHDVRTRFYLPRLDTCRRHIPTPKRMFLYCNRRRRLNVIKYIKDNENDQTRLLLNEHVMRSVYYHKIDIENHMSTKSLPKSTQKLKNSEKLKFNVDQHQVESVPNDVAKKKFLLVDEVVDLLEDEDESIIATKINRNKDEESATASAKATKSFENILPNATCSSSTNHFQICTSGGVITVKKFIEMTNINKTEQEKSNLESVMPITQGELPAENGLADETDQVDELKMPKIANCYSLNVKANTQKVNIIAKSSGEQGLDFTSATSVNSAAFSQNHDQPRKNSPNPSTATTTTATDAGNKFMLDLDNENVRDVYNSVIKTMNTLVSKKMQDIDCALQRESHIIPTPNSDILCIMKWVNFLDAFCEGFAYIWQVKMKDATFLVVTIQNVMPLVMGAMGIVNIAALKAEKIPLMGKMLLQKFRKKETEKLAVVMQGKQSYWVLKGFLKSDPNTACNKPTPESHPSLTKKINILCSLLVKQRQRDQKKKEKLTNQFSFTPQVNVVTQTWPVPTQAAPNPLHQTPKIAQIIPTRRNVPIQHRTAQQIQNSTAPIELQLPAHLDISKLKDADVSQTYTDRTEMDSTKAIAKISSRKRKPDSTQSTSLLKMESYSKMNSNIEFRSVTQSDIDEIFLPELHKLDHKWLVLDLHNDFSHIFVPDFRDLVSLDRIQKVINFARQKSKIVKLQFFQNAPFDAFVTPKSIRKIYFGPLTMKMTAPTLILLQSVDGEMMLRELYQLQHNIVKKAEEKTKAFWLVHLKGQTHFEMDVSVVNEAVLPQKVFTNVPLTIPYKTLAVLESSKNSSKQEIDQMTNTDNDDDEDCIIIEGPSTNSKTNMLPQSHILPVTSPIPHKIDNVDSPILAKSSPPVLKVPNTNTIIKPVNYENTPGPVVINVPPMAATNKPLPILTLPPNTIITGLNPSTPMMNAARTEILSVPQNAVITGIESAPPEAPYSSTIFITSTPSSTSVLPATTSTSTTGGTTVISNSLENSSVQINEGRTSYIKQSETAIPPVLDAASIKRRRISLFCSNKYDKISENLAVDAVIREILPDNAEDIQINPVRETNGLSAHTTEIVATGSSTQFSKVVSPSESGILKKALQCSTSAEVTTIKSNAPIVFDVNFMDDGDEPTASIVIKPTSSKSTSASTNTTTSKSFKLATSTATTSMPANSTSDCLNKNTDTLTNSAHFTSPPNKKNKLSTIVNNTITASTSNASAALATSEAKIINSLLCTNQTNILPKFSTPKTVTRTFSSSPNAPSVDNSIVTSSLFPCRRSSISVKVQKVGASTVETTLQTMRSTTTATTRTHQPVAPATLTVKQVQDMLNKPSLNAADVNSTIPSPLQAKSVQLLPSIKAAITPAKIAAVSASSTAIAPASQAILPPSGCTVSLTYTANKSITTPALTTSSFNPTLTISKVQSFGAPQKAHNLDKNSQKLNASQTQILINDIDDKAPKITPTPPAHIQYGYIVSTSYASQRFVAKRVADEFYVKVPLVGILKLQGLAAVNNYLNKFMNKISKEAQTTSALWQFVAASKAVQMQNHQKSLLVRKTKNTGCVSGASENKTTSPSNSIDEPILIDD